MKKFSIFESTTEPADDGLSRAQVNVLVRELRLDNDENMWIENDGTVMAGTAFYTGQSLTLSSLAIAKCERALGKKLVAMKYEIDKIVYFQFK